MKPFDLVKALAGAPVVTRDGRKVEQLAKFTPNGCIYLVGVLRDRSPNGDDLEWWRSDGSSIGNGDEHLDLFMAEPEKVKREGWVRIYHIVPGCPDCISMIYATKEDAEKDDIRFQDVAVCRIEWEEEEK